MNYSLIDQKAIPAMKSRGPHAAFDQSMNKSRLQVCMETSNAEKYAGQNISYDNSFSAIKKDILKETVDKKRQAAMTKEIIPIEEKPNKPKDRPAIHSMNNSIHVNHQDQQ